MNSHISSKDTNNSGFRHDEEHFGTRIAQAIPEIIYVYDLDSQRNTYVNRRIEEILGYTPEEIQTLGDAFLPSLLHPDDQQRLPELLARWQHARDGEILETEYRMRSREGDYRWFLARDTVFRRHEDGHVVQIIGAAQDITARKLAEFAQAQAEHDLRESERRYRFLAEHSTDLISREDLHGIFQYLSPTCARLLQYHPNELVHRSKYELIHPDDRDAVFHFHQTLLEDPAPHTFSYRVRRRDNEYSWFEVQAQVITDVERDIPLEIIAVWRDVTRRLETEQALRRSEQLFRAIVERSHDGLLMIDTHGNIRYLSPVAEQILGYSITELTAMPPEMWLMPDDWHRIIQEHRFTLNDPGSHGQALIRIRDRTGKVRHLEVTATNYLSEPLIQAFLVTFRDITDRIELETQLRQAQKMDAVGQLAGGIAHDFNNILTAVLGNVHLVLESLPDDGTLRSQLHVVEKAARRAAELTSRLLGFSRRTTLLLRPVQLNSVVIETLDLLRPTFDPRIEFHCSLAPTLAAIRADAGQLNQVLTNLCLNARDAMPHGGILQVETRNEVVNADYVRSHIYAREGSYVVLSVLDNGEGMPPEVQARVFEPFFTTKGRGEGTGLGLAMVYGIIKAHQGWITCRSEVGKGSHFEIFLPAIEQPASEVYTPVPKPLEHSSKSTHHTILLVDDEPALRTLGKTILEKSGYRVMTAEDGMAALDLFEKERHNITMIILDMTMPRLSGLDTFRQLRMMAPGIPVLFCSGYSFEQEHQFGEGVGFLQKPFRPSDLLDAVRSSLIQA